MWMGGFFMHMLGMFRRRFACMLMCIFFIVMLMAAMQQIMQTQTRFNHRHFGACCCSLHGCRFKTQTIEHNQLALLHGLYIERTQLVGVTVAIDAHQSVHFDRIVFPQQRQSDVFQNAEAGAHLLLGHICPCGL